jgi:ABC-type transporter MlaC component
VNKFAKALLLALIFAAPVTAFASQAQAKTIHHVAATKFSKIKHVKHHKHHKHHAKNIAPKTH